MPDNINNDPNQPTQQQVAASEQQPATPAPAAGQPPATPAPATPNPYAGVKPMAVPADQPHPITGTFDRLLKYINNGPSYVDAQGNPQRLQSRATLGNSILAAALAGLAQPTRYREGEFGPVVSGDATAAGAVQAGAEKQQSTNSALQTQSNDMQAKKLQTIQNNVNNMSAYAASVMLGHKFMDDTVARQQLILNDLKEYDKNQTNPDNKLIVASGLTMQDAMAQAKGNMVNYNMIPDGSKDVYNPETGTLEPTMLFSLVKNTGNVPLSDDAVTELAQVVPQYKNATALVGSGNVKVPVNTYVAQMHLLNGVHAAEQYMKAADPILGVDPSKVNFKAAILANPALQEPVKQMEHSLAQGGSTDQVLERIMKSDHGNDLLEAMGLKPDDVQNYVDKQQNARTVAQEQAKAAGKVEVKEASKPQTPQEAAQLEHTQLENKKLKNDLATTAKVGDTTKTGAEYIVTLSPQDQAQLKAIHEGRQGLSDRQLATKDGKILSEQLNAAYPDFDATKYPAYNKMRTDMTSGKASVGINRFNTALAHLATMDSHVNAWSTIPGLKTLSALTGGDAANLNADRTAVSSELAAAYKGGVASQAEVNEWNEKLNASSPYELKTSIKEVAKLLRGKLDAYQNQWYDGAPRDVVSPIRIISPKGKEAYTKITGETIPPVRGDVQTAQGAHYTFDGTQWVKQKADQ
jgi:hypothetical protein